MLVGYARVSTSEQETRLQLDALRAAGVDCVYEEKASAISARPVLGQCLASLKPGDVLVVWKLDRLARSLKHLWALIETLDERGCSIRSLTEPIDTSSALGELVLQILGAVAQFERRLIRERAIAGQVAAYRRGERWGGSVPSTVTIEMRERAAELRAQGLKWREVAAHLGVTRRSLQRALRPRKSTRGALPVLRQFLDADDLNA